MSPSQIHSTRLLKKLNTEQVRSALRACGTATKSWISHLTSLSIATCGNILDEMVTSGEALETAPAPSEGGRPARRFTYNPDFQLIFALAVEHCDGGFRYSRRIVDAVGSIKEESSTEAPSVDYARILSLAGDAAQRYPTIRAAGVGLPCVVHNGIVQHSDLPGLQEYPLRAQLEDTLGTPAVVENDMLCTTYGFYTNWTAAEESPVSVLYFPKKFLSGQRYGSGRPSAARRH